MSAPITRRGALAALVAGAAAATLAMPADTTMAPLPEPAPEPRRLDLWAYDIDANPLVALFAALELHLERLDRHVLHRLSGT